ncbi:MAG TPA: heme exporter protein CcmD [Xanthobacteraceae bacterium]|nr:heme exporter protein CcmD [Xanthobacteraceae bacterium]
MAATNHLDFIMAAYATGAAVILGLIAWVVFDYRAQRRTLADLEQRGFARRSEPMRPEPAIERAKQDA